MAGGLPNTETEKDIYDFTSDEDEPEPPRTTKKKTLAKGKNVTKPQIKTPAKAPKKVEADVYDLDSGDESEPPKVMGKRKGPAKGKRKASPAKKTKASPKNVTAENGQKEIVAGSTDNIFGSDDENEQQVQIPTPQSNEKVANKSKSTKMVPTSPFKLPSKGAAKSDVAAKPSVPKEPTGRFSKAEPKPNRRAIASKAKPVTKFKGKESVSLKHSFSDDEDTSKQSPPKKKKVEKVERPKRSTRAQVKNYKIEPSDLEEDEEESRSNDTEYNNSWVPMSSLASDDLPTSTPLPKVPELPEEASTINFLTSSPAKKTAKSKAKPVSSDIREEPMSTPSRRESQRLKEVTSSSATKEVTKRPTAKTRVAISDLQEEIASTPPQRESLRLKTAVSASASATKEVSKKPIEKAKPGIKPSVFDSSPPRASKHSKATASGKTETQPVKKVPVLENDAPQELPKSRKDQTSKKQSKPPRKLTPKDIEEIHSSPIWDETSDLSSVPDDDDDVDNDEVPLIQVNPEFDEPLIEEPVVEPDTMEPVFETGAIVEQVSLPENGALKKASPTSEPEANEDSKEKSPLKISEQTAKASEVKAIVEAKASKNILFAVPNEVTKELTAIKPSPKRTDELNKASNTKTNTIDTTVDKMAQQVAKKTLVLAAAITTAPVASMAPKSGVTSNNSVDKKSPDKQMPTKESMNKDTSPKTPVPTTPAPSKKDKFEDIYTRLKEAPVSPAAAKVLQSRRKAAEAPKTEAKILTKKGVSKELAPGIFGGESSSGDEQMSPPKLVTAKASASKGFKDSPFKGGIFDEMYKRIKQDPTSQAKAPWLNNEANRTPNGQPKFKSSVKSNAVKDTPKALPAQRTPVVSEATITPKEAISAKSRHDKVTDNASKVDSGFAASSSGKKVEKPRTVEKNNLQSPKTQATEQNEGPSEGYRTNQTDDAEDSSEDDLYSFPKHTPMVKKEPEIRQSVPTKAARRIVVVAGEEEDFIRSMTQRPSTNQDPPVTKPLEFDKKPSQSGKIDTYFPKCRKTVRSPPKHCETVDTDESSQVEEATGSPLPKLVSSQRAMESANNQRLSSTSTSPPYSPPVEKHSVKIKQERSLPSSPPIFNKTLQRKQSDIGDTSNEPIFIDSDSSEEPESAEVTPEVTPEPMYRQPELPKVKKVEVPINNKPLEEILSALSSGLKSPSPTKKARFNDLSDKPMLKSVKSEVKPVFNGNKRPAELGSPLVFTKRPELKRVSSSEDALPPVTTVTSE